MKKKALSLLLPLVLILTMLVGCGTNAAQSVPPESNQNSSSAVQAPEQASAQEASSASASEPQSVQEDPAEPEPEETQVQITYPLCPETETLSLYCTAANFMGPLSSVL